MTKPKLTPENLREIFLDLQKAQLDAVVVGGQAVNLWASQYCDRSPELRELLPFASEDLDFYGGKIEVINCRDALQGEARLNRDFDPSPNSGLVMIKRQEINLRIDFLASVYGLNDTEIDGTAIPFSGQNQLAGINIKVLHPVLCLEGKLRSLRGLPQQGRQDFKHVKMSVFCVREFLADLCQQAEPRSGLKLVERVLSNALREDGLSAWYRHGIQIESAIPLACITAQTDNKWQKFCQRRLPQILEQIEAKRQHYLEVMNRITAMTINKRLESQDVTLRKVDAQNQSPLELKTQQANSDSTPKSLWDKYSKGLELQRPVETTKAIIRAALQDGLPEAAIALILEYDPQLQKIRAEQGADEAQSYIKTLFRSVNYNPQQSGQSEQNEQRPQKPD